MTQTLPRNVNIFNTRVFDLKLSELYKIIIDSTSSDKKIIIANVNVHALNIAYKNKRFQNFLNHSHIVFCDGFGVDLASRFLHKIKLPRYTPPDWIPELCDLCQKNNFSIFLLGSRSQIVNQTAENLLTQFPDLKISGVHHGYFDKNKNSVENQKVISSINSNKTNILLVGFGMPIQEFWIEENFSELDVNVIIPIGAAIDYLAGATKRAPKWMTDNGFEWLGRLAIEPKRLWKRYIIGLPLFFIRVILQKLKGIKYTQSD